MIILIFYLFIYNENKVQIGLCKKRDSDSFAQACSRLSPCSRLLELTDDNKPFLLHLLNTKNVSCAGVGPDSVLYNTGDVRENSGCITCYEQPEYVFCQREVKEVCPQTRKCCKNKNSDLSCTPECLGLFVRNLLCSLCTSILKCLYKKNFFS